MPDRRRNRGPHPEDHELFRTDQTPILRVAVEELSWLLSRGYSMPASTTLVGNHHALHERQRLAVWRSSCSNEAKQARDQHRCSHAQLAAATLHIDGFNLLTTVEAAMAGGLVLRGRDACLRDMASMHGSWRRVTQTAQAIDAIASVIQKLGVTHCQWYLDRPVSNSGRLAAMLRAAAETQKLSWQVDCIDAVDGRLRRSTEIVITADAGILDHGVRHFPLSAEVIATVVPDVWLLDLGTD